LCHRVDEDDGEDGDGQPQEEGSAQVPDDAAQPTKSFETNYFQKVYFT